MVAVGEKFPQTLADFEEKIEFLDTWWELTPDNKRPTAVFLG